MKEHNAAFSVQVEAADKQKLEKLLSRLKEIDREAGKINREAQERAAALPQYFDREIRRKGQRQARKFRMKLEDLAEERVQIAEQIRKISRR